VLRFLLWRMLGLAALVVALALIAYLLDGGLGAALRGTGGSLAAGHATGRGTGHLSLGALARALDTGVRLTMGWGPFGGPSLAEVLVSVLLCVGILVGGARVRARAGRIYTRLEVQAYRADTTTAEGVVTMFHALHKRLLRRWWRRLIWGQPSIALEVHHAGDTLASSRETPDAREHPETREATEAREAREVWLAVCCPAGLEEMVETALRGAYPNCRLLPTRSQPGAPPVVLRLKKQAGFIRRVKTVDLFEHAREPSVNRLMSVMAASGEPAFVQLALTPAPTLFERHARHLYKRHEARLSRERREHLVVHDRSLVEDTELRGGLDVQHQPLFFADLRVIAPSRPACERIASELRAVGAENSLVERGTTVRHGRLGLYDRRVKRGEGNPLAPVHKGVFAPTELAALWHLPSVDFASVPFARSGVPRAPAPPSILRPSDGPGTLRDALGTVTIHPSLRKQNTAVPGAVEQGKSSYLVATVAEDLRRERCAVIVLDPKGDAADAAVSLVPADRTCTFLDFAHPTCGFNPLAVDAPADVIADYVVASLKNLFTDADIRASSDRYLRNAIIAVLAYDRESTLWDAARLLSVGEEGYAYRNAVGARVRTMPEFKEISEFFTAELSAQLADARSTTTAKLDAPVNKLARLLNSPSIKRVLLNDSLLVDFDRAIAGEEVLVVKGALGAMGAGNTSVLMQLLVGMLDAALARQQDLVCPEQRVAVALKVDEAPLVLNRGFAETMALKRSAGLETVACWQTEAQWTDPEVRDQLDALFAHRVYFATSSSLDARAAVKLTMAEFSDMVRPGIERISTLGRPDARLHLPKHHAIASWLTVQGRQSPFVAETIPLHVDRERLLLHATRQAERGGRHRSDLRQPHWDRRRRDAETKAADEPSAGKPRSDEPRSDEPGAAEPGAAERTIGPDGAPRARVGALPETPPDSFRELIELDGASSVRWARPAAQPKTLDPEQLDLEIIGLVAGLRHVLTSQIHRHFNPGRSLTTTQRRLKRLCDAGLVERFQFHRRDGGGVPMCYVVTRLGLELLGADDRLDILAGSEGRTEGEPSNGARLGAASRGDHRLGQARHDVHVAGWVLAFEQALTGCEMRSHGPAACVLSPPSGPGAPGRGVFGPGDLHLPNGRTPHAFMRTVSDGERVEIERFETVRPDAIVEVSPPTGPPASRGSSLSRAKAIDVIIERDDRLASGAMTGKLERYDHFIAGWSVHTRRYGPQGRARSLLVFLCRDRSRARECARRADAVLGACRAYAGEYPFDWEYPGREAIVFVSERDAHEGLTVAYGVPVLPPQVRVCAAHGDPTSGQARVREVDLASTLGASEANHD
jgi:hypothetical protein